VSAPASLPPVREVTAEAELLAWDDWTVRRPGGHVYQSRAWAAHLERRGWRARHLVIGEAFGVLSMERRWPAIGGGSAYLMRGPIPSDPAPAETVARLVAVTEALAGEGVDVVATDAEVPAESGYPALLRGAGFHPIPEIQPSRHRMTLPLDTGADEAGLLAGCSKATRQRIRAAERDGIVAVRYDRELPAEPLSGAVRPTEPFAAAAERFYEQLRMTGDRRRFFLGAREDFVPWWIDAHAAGFLVHLEARAEGRPVAGLMLYRHGGRISTVHSADDVAARRSHPGALHLLRWAAIRLALAEGASEMDLGGVDVAGARRPPRPGEPMYGLYEHKLSYGARWLELSGAHERILDPVGYRLGTLLAGVARRLPGGRRGR
jgi:peptidoglycan pentaglycine glycine transferase (the first glycine)